MLIDMRTGGLVIEGSRDELDGLARQIADALDRGEAFGGVWAEAGVTQVTVRRVETNDG